MLEELDIKNFALIDSAHVDFNGGFTVLSGETGAGKSILIGSLAFLLGGKASPDQIRTGMHEAQVSGSFHIDSKEAFAWLEDHGMEAEDDRVLLRRLIRDTGKSSAWICGVPVTRADLASFADFLVDIHGQHEQQSLMKVADHRRYLDIYADIVDEVSSFTVLYDQLVEKRRVLDSLNSNEAERTEKIDMLSFAVNEITEAKLKANEDEDLEAEESKLSSFEKLYSDIEEITAAFDGDDNSGGIIPGFKRLAGTASKTVELDKNLQELEGRLQSAFYEIDDIAQEFRRYRNSLVFDPDRLVQVQERLDLIYKLKKKYAGGINGTVADVMAYLDRAQKQLDELTGSGADKSVLEKEISDLEKKVYTAAKSLSDKRKTASEKMSKAVEEILSKLGMKETRFRVNLTEKEGNEVEQKCGPYGMDNIEFLISANPGSPLLPLARIASGGELSRVMLALKTILSAADLAGTLVFDEIDTGIGGEVAVAVGEHMKKLSAKKQILCITHLASIAVYADNQIKIQKGVEGNTTATNVFPIEGQDRVREIARMLSGDSVSQASLDHAAAMLKEYSC
ncbi:MAG: DNA repair protein RecN [Treponema sp.]|nr:DNA repair protein RecN [Candidatus Treponema equi]